MKTRTTMTVLMMLSVGFLATLAFAPSASAHVCMYPAEGATGKECGECEDAANTQVHYHTGPVVAAYYCMSVNPIEELLPGEILQKSALQFGGDAESVVAHF